MDKKVLILGGVGVSLISTAAGAVGGYYYAKKKLWNEFSNRLEEEVESTKKFYNTLTKREFRTPGEALRELHPEGLDLENSEPVTNDVSEETLEKILVHLKYKDDHDRPDERHLALIRGGQEEEVHANIFDELRVEHHLPEDFNEEEARELDIPYIIPVDVFMHGEVGFNQLTFTFFTEDRVLVDEEDNIIGTSVEKGDYVDELIGMDNLLFGHMSKDSNCVYIRNNKTGYDYEILRSQGSYAEVVAGITS